jgi:hypothetical protein
MWKQKTTKTENEKNKKQEITSHAVHTWSKAALQASSP